MKKIAFLLTFIALSAQAEMIITGGFGTDGATGESIPLKRSIKDAAEVYRALKIDVDSREMKVIALEDESSFECEKPSRGMSRETAGCQITLRSSQNGKLVRGNGLSGTVTFSGKLATKIFNALPMPTGPMPVGATTKKVANLTCSKVVRPGVEATCKLTDTNAVSMDVAL